MQKNGWRASLKREKKAWGKREGNVRRFRKA